MEGQTMMQWYAQKRLPTNDSNKKNVQTKKMFLEEMRAELTLDNINILKQWQLKDINLREFASGKGDVPVWDVMREIANAVPSVKCWEA